MTMTEAEARLQPGRMLIGGEWVAESSAGTFVHINPSTGAEHPVITQAGAPEVDAAVRAAAEAFPAWRAMPVDQRRDAMLRMAALVRQNAPMIGALTALDIGAPMMFGVGLAMACADNLTYYAGWVDKIGGDVIPTWPQPALDYAIMEPYGVVGLIIPWNVPSYNVGQVVGAALAANNCVVLKAPDLAPFTVLKYGELALEAGIPPGVLNIVAGGAETGAAMVAHPGIAKIHFIGGGNAAKAIMKSAADTLKPVTFELGGKSANIIFEDADLAAAAAMGVHHSMGNSGQGCLNATRMLVQDSVYDQVVGIVKHMADNHPVGMPFDEGVMMGPVVNSVACDRIMGVIEKAKAEGDGTLLSGGERLGGELANGYFIAPTIFHDVDNSGSLAQNEVFGPVLAVIRFSDEADAIQKANDSQFGLAAYAHTNDLKRAHRVASALEAGSVWINGMGLRLNAPFGGVKQSGFGRMGGRWGVEDFLAPKNVYIPL